MIPDFNTYLRESHWSEMNRRSQGITVRKEDDVNLMNIDMFFEYLIKRYWRPNEKVQSLDLDHYSREFDKDIVVDPIKGCVIYGNYKDGELKRIFIVYRDAKLEKMLKSYHGKFIFIPSEPGKTLNRRYYVIGKDNQVSNKLFVDLIELILSYSGNGTLKESHWSEMNRRSQGITVRKEEVTPEVLRKRMADKIWKAFEENGLSHYFDGPAEWWPVSDEYYMDFNLEVVDKTGDPEIGVFQMTDQQFKWTGYDKHASSANHSDQTGSKYRYGPFDLVVGYGIPTNPGYEEVPALVIWADAISNEGVFNRAKGEYEFLPYDSERGSYVGFHIMYNYDDDRWLDEYDEEIDPDMIKNVRMKKFLWVITQAVNPNTKYKESWFK